MFTNTNVSVVYHTKSSVAIIQQKIHQTGMTEREPRGRKNSTGAELHFIFGVVLFVGFEYMISLAHKFHPLCLFCYITKYLAIHICSDNNVKQLDKNTQTVPNIQL